MATTVPEGEAIRRAVKWISHHLQDDPNKSVQKLVNEAVMRFDLSPKDGDFLTDFFRQGKTGRTMR